MEGKIPFMRIKKKSLVVLHKLLRKTFQIQLIKYKKLTKSLTQISQLSFEKILGEHTENVMSILKLNKNLVDA